MRNAAHSPDGAAVRLTGIHKSFGKVQAVRGVDLQISPGEVVAFLGPNGAGKSTTIDVLLGLIRPDSGTASLFGTSPLRAVQAGRVGAMLQGGGLLPEVGVGELISMFAALHRSPMPVAEAMDRAGITDIAKQRTSKLSGGQAQRVRYALALVPDPDLFSVPITNRATHNLRTVRQVIDSPRPDRQRILSLGLTDAGFRRELAAFAERTGLSEPRVWTRAIVARRENWMFFKWSNISRASSDIAGR